MFKIVDSLSEYFNHHLPDRAFSAGSSFVTTKACVTDELMSLLEKSVLCDVEALSALMTDLRMVMEFMDYYGVLNYDEESELR